ncbi:hypothetical protein MTR67_026880 [Solanum verrucosum]|uniref:Uncharacterized protein n=1 Tax=Solanum verrucosum TaxID=315347 RepID=A0AAF0R6D7_SOLVR|nr:hypothetical protein MTR67_026880 [Solanum verrucosum]
MTILYHSCKANMVADALSRKSFSMGSLASIRVEERPLARDVERLANNFVQLRISKDGSVLSFLRPRSSLIKQIQESQFKDEKLYIIRDKVTKGEANKAYLILRGC